MAVRSSYSARAYEGAFSGAESPPASPTTYFVSTTGDNAKDGLNGDNAWETLVYAEANAPSGSIIALKKGDTFTSENILEITTGGSIDNHTIWDGGLWGGGANAIIQSTHHGGTAPYWRSIIRFVACNYVTFQNITVDGSDMNRTGITIGGDHSYYGPTESTGEHHITIQDCVVKNIGDATYYWNGIYVSCFEEDITNIIIQRNEIYHTAAHGLALYPTAEIYLDEPGHPEMSILDCYIGYNNIYDYRRYSENTGFAIMLSRKTKNTIVEHNILTDTHGTNHVLVVGAESSPGKYPTDIIIKYNMIVSNKANISSGILSLGGQPQTVEIYGNIIYVNGNNSIGIYLEAGGNDYTGADFKIYNNTIYSADASRCIYDGTNVAASTYKNNILYNNTTNLCAHFITSGVVTHSNNLYFKNGGGDWINEGGVGYANAGAVQTWEVTSEVTDPTFVIDFTDLHLQLGSPAIGAGVTIVEFTKDYDDETYDDPTRAIGAYEYIAP